MGKTLIWKFTYPLSFNQASLLNRRGAGSVFPSCTPWRYQFTKFSLPSCSFTV